MLGASLRLLAWVKDALFSRLITEVLCRQLLHDSVSMNSAVVAGFNLIEETNPENILDREAVQAQCSRVAESEEFRTAPLQQKLLKYLVSETLEGRGPL